MCNANKVRLTQNVDVQVLLRMRAVLINCATRINISIRVAINTSQQNGAIVVGLIAIVQW